MSVDHVAPGSKAAHDTFQAIGENYEYAYRHNPMKAKAVQAAIKELPKLAPPLKILDVGCGTGYPVLQMLIPSGHELIGIDISQRMLDAVSEEVKHHSQLICTDMLSYHPPSGLAAVFVMFSHLQISYDHFTMWLRKSVDALARGGLLIIGTCPSDNYTTLDDGKTYIEDVPIPFMGGMEPTLALTEKGMRELVVELGLEIVSEDIGIFTPRLEDRDYEDEHQQYIIARRLE